MRGDGTVSLESAQLAVLANAAREAEQLRRHARESRARLLADAREQAQELLAQRLASAEQLAERERREQLAEARSEARRVVLRARQAVLTDAYRAVRVAARELVHEPAYAELMRVLTTEAQERLSTPAQRARVAAAPGGGLLARAGSHEIDYSLDSQVDRCMRAMPDELERLWR